MAQKPKLSKAVNKRDVVLCETTNRVVSMHTTSLLIDSSISFSSKWSRVPFFKRAEYNGANKVCTISISRTEYGRARRALTQLARRDYNRLMMNVI